MFQITALYQDREEVGYGESHSLEDAMIECIESVPAMYPSDEVVLVCRVSMADAMVPA